MTDTCRFTGTLALLDNPATDGRIIVDHGGPIADQLPVPLFSIGTSGDREIIGRIDRADRDTTPDGQPCIAISGDINETELPPEREAPVGASITGMDLEHLYVDRDDHPVDTEDMDPDKLIDKLSSGELRELVKTTGDWRLTYVATGPDYQSAFPEAAIRRA